MKIILKLFLILCFSNAIILADATFKKENSNLKKGKWVDKSLALKFVSKSVLKYLAKGNKYDASAIHSGFIKTHDTSLERVKRTLLFLIKVVEEDAKIGKSSRLTDPNFILKHFDLIKWSPDLIASKKLAQKKPLLKSVNENKILLTKYFIKLADGNKSKTDDKSLAIYGLPFDEVELTLEEALTKRTTLTRFKYGKQVILKGIISNNNLAPALVWLNRTDLEGALLQGTVVVNIGNSKTILNVHRNNTIAYDRSKKPREQERYWYFKEVDHIYGYGKDANFKIAIKSEVTVAGDLNYFGLGKIFLLKTIEHDKPTYRITILADTGGAFKNNQFQLDWLSGYYKGWKDYHKINKYISDTAETWILLKK
ncbi:MAG: hypothetical protein COA79_05115 [Planctomycetota bacterium]|nr:MAG: hypothetical protein COA79_05115 [Planctomycetota bacterium]